MNPSGVTCTSDMLRKIDKKLKRENQGTVNNVTQMTGGKKRVPVPGLFKRPVVGDIEMAAKRMIGHKKITVLTGAGLSAASGIPTFRGQVGL